MIEFRKLLIAHWKLLFIATCVTASTAGTWFNLRLTFDGGENQPKSQNASEKAEVPVIVEAIGPAEKTRSEKMGFGPVIKELDINRIGNAEPVVVPFVNKTTWTALVEDALVQRNAVLRGLRRQLQESLAKPDPSYGGQFHYLLIAIGEFRDRESLSQLGPHFDFELDQSTLLRCFPVHFPVAEAIGKIGGLDAADLMVKRANERMSRRQLFLAAWILRESLPKNRTQEYLRSSLTSAKSPLQIRNLERLMEFMESEPAKLTLNGLSGELIDGLMQKDFPAFVESK